MCVSETSLVLIHRSYFILSKLFFSPSPLHPSPDTSLQCGVYGLYYNLLYHISSSLYSSSRGFKVFFIFPSILQLHLPPHIPVPQHLEAPPHALIIASLATLFPSNLLKKRCFFLCHLKMPLTPCRPVPVRLRVSSWDSVGNVRFL